LIGEFIECFFIFHSPQKPYKKILPCPSNRF
jgi:hypothetical protein